MAFKIKKRPSPTQSFAAGLAAGASRGANQMLQNVVKLQFEKQLVKAKQAGAQAKLIKEVAQSDKSFGEMATRAAFGNDIYERLRVPVGFGLQVDIQKTTATDIKKRVEEQRKLQETEEKRAVDIDIGIAERGAKEKAAAIGIGAEVTPAEERSALRIPPKEEAKARVRVAIGDVPEDVRIRAAPHLTQRSRLITELAELEVSPLLKGKERARKLVNDRIVVKKAQLEKVEGLLRSLGVPLEQETPVLPGVELGTGAVTDDELSEFLRK